MTFDEAEEILMAHEAGAFSGRTSEVVHARLMLDNRCPRCDGIGKVLYGDEEESCGTCDGTGIHKPAVR